MRQPTPRGMFNSLPDYLQACLSPQMGDDYVICHVKKRKVEEFMAIMGLLGFKFMNGYWHRSDDDKHASVASDNWANVRDIYNWINGTNHAPTIDMEMGTGGKLMINVIG